MTLETKGLEARGRPGATSSLHQRYAEVRARSVAIARPLSPEDCTAQSMPDASPVKWHLAHTSWFFETFVLAPNEAEHRPFDPAFTHLFNSYYHGVGPQFARHERGLVTRPGLARVLEHRADVDRRMAALLDGPCDAIAATVELGLAHEEQHQELMLTDLKHLLSRNPLLPAYAGRWPLARVAAAATDWIAYPGGVHGIGHDGDGFAFDNEGPRHDVLLAPFELCTHPVSNAEWIAFIEDGGYARPDHWLSDGWDRVKAEGWEAPLYWRRAGGQWRCFTLHGEGPVDPTAPVCHISFYEADAFARWSGARLPTEAEWEVAAGGLPVAGNFFDGASLHPTAPSRDRPPGAPAQMFGDVWEWTRSAYEPYPGFRPAEGAVGEYNGKFMSGQQVLRGGSCATPPGHVRATYRNFFPPHARWQFSGLRLARDGKRRPTGGVTRPGPRFRTLSRPQADVACQLARGLMADPPRIASGHFYDDLGSRLFEAITDLPEYGLTRAEAGIFEREAAAIAAEAEARLGSSYQMVDLGAGNCRKAERLLPTLKPSRYVAVDIAAEFLESALARVAAAAPGVDIHGLGMDFARGFSLPEDLADRPTLFFYPGSSIGNFDRDEARQFLAGLRGAVGHAAILMGADLVREPEALVAAYDDALGVTAAFNRNILANVNRLMGANFAPEAFAHVALWNAAEARVEMHLEARTTQTVRWPGGGRTFAAGTRIWTEISTKWTPETLDRLLEEAGFGKGSTWFDPERSFAVVLAG